MLAPSKMTLAGVVAVLAAAPLVSAHGYMSVPKATFAINGDPTQFCATMNGPTTLTAQNGQTFTNDPASNTKAFTAALKASSYKDIKSLINAKATFISGASKECGVTSATGAKQPLPEKYVEWAHSDSEGFTPSHQGPCEVWCDDSLAFSDENCAANYQTAPAKLPYDKSKCTGASMLKIYWLALHSSTWQAYINCAPLEGGSSSSSGNASTTPSVTPSKTPAASKTPSPATPSVNKTPAPSSSTGDDYDDEDCDDELPIADSDSGSVGADEDCDDDLPIAGDEDCDDELPIADSDAGSVGGDADTATKAPVATTKPSTGKTPAATTKPSTAKTPKPTTAKTPKPTKATSTKTPKPTSAKTPSPASDDEVGGDADTGASEDCDNELPIADDEDCDDELPIAGSDAGSVGADEDCDDELPIAGDEDCDDELDIAGSESVRTTDLDFSSLSTADKSKIGKVDAY